MRDLIKATGMVLLSSPVGDYDKRLIILTKERGKLTCFARGAKRPGSALRAPSCPFAFGVFTMSESRDAYNLFSAEIENYFEDMATDVERACYASYFAEFASYYGRENLDASEMIRLLYQSFRALIKPSIPNTLVRRIFELRLMAINGEYREDPWLNVSDSASYAWEFVLCMPLEKLYTFLLTDQVLEEFSRCVEENKRRYVDRTFHSLEILREIT